MRPTACSLPHRSHVLRPSSASSDLSFPALSDKILPSFLCWGWLVTRKHEEGLVAEGEETIEEGKQKEELAADLGAHHCCVSLREACLIHTAELCGANALQYLIELQKHAAELAINPTLWMPWNYRDALVAAGV